MSTLPQQTIAQMDMVLTTSRAPDGAIVGVLLRDGQPHALIYAVPGGLRVDTMQTGTELAVSVGNWSPDAAQPRYCVAVDFAPDAPPIGGHLATLETPDWRALVLRNEQPR